MTPEVNCRRYGKKVLSCRTKGSLSPILEQHPINKGSNTRELAASQESSLFRTETTLGCDGW